MARKKGKRKAARRARKTSRKATKKAARRTHKRAARKAKAAPKKSKAPKKAKAPATSAKQKTVGLVTHFYPHISVGIVEVKAPLKIGDSITISGHGKSFKQKIISMQIDHEPITTAKKGDFIGIKVAKPVKEKDIVLK